MTEEKYIAKTLFGLEQVLVEELNEIGAQNVTPLKRAVSFTGDKKMLYEANYRLRTAISILKPIANFKVNNEDDIYRHISRINWNHYMEINSTFLVNAVVNSKTFKHSKYVAYKTKDAIVDQFRRKTGKRPSIDTESPDLKINIHIAGNDCDLSLDSSGDPLFKRGYRIEGYRAPLNEVLAAGMIKLSGWDTLSTFIDPMCGSGTLLIEAALMATNTPPGYFREDFGFMNWKDYDINLFEEIKNQNNIKNTIKCNIYGSDISVQAFDIANKNLLNAGMRDFIKLKKIAFEEFVPPDDRGLLISNPPFGERIQVDNLNEFYTTLGSRFKHNYNGYDVWLLSSNFEALKHIGLRPSRKHTLFNGALECKYQHFQIYSGSKKSG